MYCRWSGESLSGGAVACLLTRDRRAEGSSVARQFEGWGFDLQVQIRGSCEFDTLSIYVPGTGPSLRNPRTLGPALAKHVVFACQPVFGRDVDTRETLVPVVGAGYAIRKLQRLLGFSTPGHWMHRRLTK